MAGTSLFQATLMRAFASLWLMWDSSLVVFAAIINRPIFLACVPRVCILKAIHTSSYQRRGTKAHLHRQEDRRPRVLNRHLDRRPSEEAKILKWLNMITAFRSSMLK